MVEYVDRVIQMVDGRVERILEDKMDIGCLINPGRPECQAVPPEALGFGATQALGPAQSHKMA